MNILNIILAVLAFVRQYGQLARPVIEAELSALLASGKLTQAQYDAIELILNLALGAGMQAKLAGQTPTAAAFRKEAGY